MHVPSIVDQLIQWNYFSSLEVKMFLLFEERKGNPQKQENKPISFQFRVLDYLLRNDFSRMFPMEIDLNKIMIIFKFRSLM